MLHQTNQTKNRKDFLMRAQDMFSVGKKMNLLGSIVPWGKLTSKTIQKANTKVESNSMRRQSHSIAERLQKNGRAKQSRR